MTVTAPTDELDAIADAPPPTCYGRNCDRAACWIGTVFHESGAACTTVTACAWHKAANETLYRRLKLLDVAVCRPHRVDMLLTWRRL